MNPLLWLALAWIAGILSILGSLMTLGSLLLWLVPFQPDPSPAPNYQKEPRSLLLKRQMQGFQRLQLLLVSLVISLAGMSLIIAFPFPKA